MYKYVLHMLSHSVCLVAVSLFQVNFLLDVLTAKVSDQLASCFLAVFIITRQPRNVKVCKGEVTIFNCGYFASVDIQPLWIINGSTSLRRSAIDNDPNDLLQWIVDGNDTNTTRLSVGPVDESYVGRTTFQCEIPLGTPVVSDIATLTVIG